MFVTLHSSPAGVLQLGLNHENSHFLLPPHLYLMPNTDVPVTIGWLVCCLVPSMAAAACSAPRGGPAAA